MLRTVRISGAVRVVAGVLAALLLMTVGTVRQGWAGPPRNIATSVDSIRVVIPSLTVDNESVHDAFRIALGDLMGNVALFQDGLLERPMPVMLAGLDYDMPWTRDAAINAWNGASLIIPDVARNTLLSVLERSHGKVRIGGQYWDRIVWVTGAWNHYLYTGDREFLALALEATRTSLASCEEAEFDAGDNLFRGPGWSDGVAAYPDVYAQTGGSSEILEWPKHNTSRISKPGYGIPMKALSTNCLYYSAYITAGRMATELDVAADPQWLAKAERLRQAINTHLWDESHGNYRFLVGPLGNCDHQEGLGSAYALLYGIADARQAELVLANQHVTPAGLPCGWPNFARYERPDGQSFGREIGTVWPQIQGFWAEAAARAGKADLFGHEFLSLATHAARDKHFAEVYHPITCQPYGGLQEADGKGIVLWEAMSRQTWAATAFLRMVLRGLVGMRFDTDGVRFHPCVPPDISSVVLQNLAYRNMDLTLIVRGTGTHIQQCLVNNEVSNDGFVSVTGEGHQEVIITMSEQ
jgi:glycogen debranching enzyme